MKALRSSAIVVAVVVGCAVLLAVPSASAKMMRKDWSEDCQEHIKVLKDSAALLQKNEPDLAKGLTDLAAQKEKKLQEMTEKKAKYEAKAKLLRDSAAALQKTNPDLAKELWDMSDYKRMGKGMGMKKCPMMGKGMMQHEEAEEHEKAAE